MLGPSTLQRYTTNGWNPKFWPIVPIFLKTSIFQILFLILTWLWLRYYHENLSTRVQTFGGILKKNFRSLFEHPKKFQLMNQSQESLEKKSMGIVIPERNSTSIIRIRLRKVIKC